MRLSKIDVQYVKAAEGAYTASEVARHYNVHPSTVGRIWEGVHHADVSPADDCPDIPRRLRGSELYEDINILISRGLSNKEVAEQLDCSVSTVNAVGRGLFL